ncbi:AraC-like ligand-binding domain-containing protein [Streptomyces jumonjinensis]|uniref:Helix-turn-helix domain-containing protein n=1 Tax=Streptomyces jumonjinensis TaxID=1945 RepID=A0A646KMK8_STRJU|nr:helix-turn-helix domain-containing protein [Streptomyces jumonjinensis]MQT03277.1 helix-turn-helix domain-containing protein [Streptomyces jumonjinensis]
MMVTAFSTEDVPARERFAYFEASAALGHVPTCIRSEREDDFRASMRVLELGDLLLSSLTFPRLTCVRTPRLIRQWDPEVYEAHYMVQGAGGVSQAGREAAITSGKLVLVDSSEPHQAWLTADTDTLSMLIIRVPRTLLPLPPKEVRRAVARPVDLTRGIGGAFHRWLTGIETGSHEFTASDVPTLASVTVDLLASLLERVLETEGGETTPETRGRVLRLEVQEFIQQHLGDPSLSPATIAAAHRISVSYLHKLFHEQELTVAGWIRRRRLEQCRRDLADPGLARRPIHAIAARWGFTSNAHFSRAFRTAYDISPREYRRSALNSRSVHGSSMTVPGRSTTS